MKRTIITLLVAISWLIALQAQGQTSIINTPYPNAVKYLPPPPDTLSMAFAYDVHRYIVGMSLRDTERGQQARSDVGYGLSYVAARMRGCFGLDPSSSKYPALRQLMADAMNYVGQACSGPKSYYNRLRPFARFHDPLFSSESAASLAGSGSYPSAHSMMGWAGALVLSEVNPKLQDELFENGYEYGQSRIIVGAHWQSDVDAARMMTAATFARLHANEQYLAMVDHAQQVYDSVTHNVRPSALDQIHPYVRFLPEMPDSTGAAFASDVTLYYQNKQLRQGERGQQAHADADMSVDGIIGCFSSILGTTVNATRTPVIYDLLTTVVNHARDNCIELQRQHRRTPPYRRLGEPALSGTTSTEVSCYPSCHATVGWVAAMVMMDICPTHQNNILKRGREYGQSRVIAGTNWQSDVDAGQLLGGMIFANLMSDRALRNQLTAARNEFNAVSGLNAIQATVDDTPAAEFTLDGRCATTDSRGVIVSTNGKKQLR